MRILVVGAGATGGYFGARLAQAGRDVTFLVRAAHAERLRANGLQIKSPHGDAAVKVQLALAGQLQGAFDLVLLAVKAYSLASALNDLAPAVGGETTIVPLLNGMAHVDTITERFGAGALVGGLCRIAATLEPDGRIAQLAPFQEIAFGEWDGSRSARIERLDQELQHGGFEARLSGHILREMWEKWVMLAALASATCLLRGSVGEIVAAPGGAECALRLLEEAAAVARAAGEAPGEAFLARTRSLLTRADSSLTASMYRDLQQNHPIEAEQIVGDLVARGLRAGVDTPLLGAAWIQLALYQRRLRAG